MLRLLTTLSAALAMATATQVRAQQNGFDLAGPDLSVAVTRGGVQLPIAAVPSLRAGDRITAKAALPADQSAHYVLVLAFLRGATNPPPKKWFFRVETWEKKNVLDVVVPEGAEQAILLMAPEAGGGFEAVRDAVRGRPGVFVRASQDLFQASLDRARLDTFVSGIARVEDSAPERLASVAPVLADALRIKLNSECLSRQRALQAACLTQNRDSLVLQAQRGTTLADTLTGTPVNLAYGVAATREGGSGYYSPYIGLARDIARLFGAFRSAQYQYLPTLAVGRADRLHLQLNSAPSFQNPRSVLVAPLAPIGASPPPVWRAGKQAAMCLAEPGLVMPLDDAALLFATDYARDLTLRITTADGRSVELPVALDVDRGGVKLAAGTVLPKGIISGAVLHGRWGFDTFTGPRLPVQLDGPDAWTPQPDGAVVVGRDHPLVLRGGAPACITQLTLRDETGGSKAVTWKATAPDEVQATLPLGRTRPGPLNLLIMRYGSDAPASIALTGRLEASRLDRFTVHAGDRAGVLEGARLDQVAALDLAGRHFEPGALTRGAERDRLALTADAPVDAVKADAPLKAVVQLRDGRTAKVDALVAAARPSATLIARQVAFAPAEGSLPTTMSEELVPTDAGLTFSVRSTERVGTDDAVEIATDAGDAQARLTVASGAVQRVGENIVVASVTPRTLLGAGVTGSLRFRLWQNGVATEWQPLANVVRLPEITAVNCLTGEQNCTVTGRNLFLVAAVSGAQDFAQAVTLPAGFVGSSITMPRPQDGALFLRLHDAPGEAVRVQLPTGA